MGMSATKIPSCDTTPPRPAFHWPWLEASGFACVGGATTIAWMPVGLLFLDVPFA
jgi:hypothetical protein